MEQQVAEAAMAIVGPTTNAATRTAASHFLEEWTRTAEAWDVYTKWLQSFSFSNPQVLGTQLLCLTLLQAKIRREVVSRNNNNGAVLVPAAAVLQPIYSHLLTLLQSTNVTLSASSSSLVRPLCVCTAALAVRTGNLQELVTIMCQSASIINRTVQHHAIPPVVALRVLACLPAEVEACQDLTTPQVTQTLLPFMEIVLDTVRRALSSADTVMQSALEALQSWAETCHVTLSHLNSPTCGGTESLLPRLLQILSQPSSVHQSSQVLISAGRALTEAILVPTDSCTPSRDEAVATMIQSIASSGFIAAPFLAFIDNDDDVCHAMSTLLGTLVTEEVDYVASQPSEPLLRLLLQVQSHPSIPVTIPILECWLTVQEVPTSDRHDHWKAPLFRSVLEGLVVRIAYPASFTNWQEEVELDRQEFAELRRMVTDVLISCYFLLRVDFLQHLSAQQGGDWTRTESALFCLSCVSREVCARVQARGGDESVRWDREATSRQLLLFVQAVTSQSSTSSTHPLLSSGIASFIGSYAPAWNVLCSSDALLHLLAHLRQNATMSEEECKATRSLHVECASKLIESNSHEALLTSVRESMDACLQTDNEVSMAAVAEGSTRLIVRIKDKSIVRQSLGNIIIAPLLQRADAAVAFVVSQTPQSEAAVVALAKYLNVLQVIVRFCDTPKQNGEVHVLCDVLPTLRSFLEKISHQCGQYEEFLSAVLAVHGQLLNTVPELVAPNFTATVKFVVAVFEQMKLPGALDYIASAVEAFSPMEDATKESFKELLRHFTTVVVSYVTTEKRPDECPRLIRAFFEMNQRFMLFCPSGLIGCLEFPTIVSLAVECLSACKGERQSVRATLIFLSQLFGWKSLRLSNTSTDALDVLSGKIDEQLLLHGEVVTQSCVDGLAGGPQMLWPALSECLFAITAHVAGDNASGPAAEENTVAHQWVYSALSNCQGSNGEAIQPETCQQIMLILFELSRDGL